MSLDQQALEGLRIDRSAAPASKISGVAVALVVVLLVAGAGAAAWAKWPHAATVRTATVQETSTGGQKTLLNASGYVTARRQATISSKVTGKVMVVMAEEGMKVEAGQILARLDDSNVVASLKLAQAQLEAGRKELGETIANMNHAEREFKRVATLAAVDYASKSDLDRAEALMKSLSARLERQQAEVAVAEREVAIWEQQVEDMVIRAPFAGIVVSKNAQPGEVISPMSAGGYTRTGICTIVDMSSLEVEVDVNESYINRVKPGQPAAAMLDAYSDWTIPAKVIAIIPTADRQKATVKVRVGFEALDPRILPDMSVKVAFNDGGGAPASQREITIPKAALREIGGQAIVWVVRNGQAERREVTVKSAGADTVVIAAGLAGGEKVVIAGAENLTDGAAVAESSS